MPQAVVGDGFFELGHKGHTLGARADEAHVALQDIPDLGQLVYAHLADELAELCYARIMGAGPYCSVLFGIGAHGAELVDREFLFKKAHAILFVNDRAGRFQPHHNGRQQHDGCCGNEEEQGNQHVQRALEPAQRATRVQRKTLGLQQPLIVDLRERQALHHVLVKTADIHHHAAAQLCFQKVMGNVVVNGRIGQQKDHGRLFFFGNVQCHEGGTKARPGIRPLITLAHIAKNLGLGQAFCEQLAHLACAVHPYQQNAQRVGKPFGVEVVNPAPAQRKGQRKGKKHGHGFAVKTPVLKGIRSGSRRNNAEQTGYQHPPHGFLEVLVAHAVRIEDVKEEHVKEDGKERSSRIVVENAQIGFDRQKAGNAESQ